MSIDSNVLSVLPSLVNATNAESGANAALASWKNASTAWSQETADAVGKSSVDYAMKWNFAVIPVIEAKITKFKAEYEEKKSNYDSVKSQYDSAGKAVEQAKKDMDACMDYPQHGSMHGVRDPNEEKVVVDRDGYNLAKNRKAQAEAEQNRYKAQMDSWKRQMNDAKSKMDSAENEKSKERRKIEQFIMDVYALNLMNESIVFLHALKTSSVEISKPNQNKLYSRLFFIENKYRASFEKFEQIITATKDKYKESSFNQTPESLKYSALRLIKTKKFKNDLSVSLNSESSDSAKLSYTSSKEFIISKNKIQDAQEKVQAECKNFTLSVDRGNFKIELNKNYENDAIVGEIDQIDSNSDVYVSECEKLMDVLQANGASSSKLKLFFGKIGNNIAHSKEKREAYKKMTPEERKAAKAAEKQKKRELKEAKNGNKTSGETTSKGKNKKSKLRPIIIWLIAMVVLFIVAGIMANQ